jgi:lysozyme
MTDPRTPAFDAVGAICPPGLWNDPGNILAFHNLLDAFGAQRAGKDESFDDAIIAHLRAEEGVRRRAYKDHLGYWTIGVGRLIDSRKKGRITPEEDAILMANDPSRRGKPWRDYVLTDAEIDMLLRNDVAEKVAAIRDWPAWKAVGRNVARRVALTSMAFQMGVDGLADFRNSLALVAAGDFAGAADNMLKSLWARQTPERAKRVTEMMRTGTLP